MQDQLTDSSLRLIVVEDEAPARLKLLAQLAQFGEVEVIAECDDAKQAIQAINTLRPDVVLLDIELGELNGFDVLHAIESSCRVIFTTAYSRYAVEAFEKRALDYLLKPYDTARLQEALERVSTRDIKPKGEATLPIKTGGKTHFIPVKDICCIAVEEGNLRIRCLQRVYYASDSLGSIAARLPSFFIQVHRNRIININQLEQADKHPGDCLLLRFRGNSDTIVTSRRGAAVLRHHLKLHGAI